jgi:hypothetical protein
MLNKARGMGLAVSVACTKRKDVRTEFCPKILNKDTTFDIWAQMVGKH